MPSFNLSDVQAEKRAKDDPIVIELDGDAKPVVVPGVLCWPDDALELINVDPVKAARLVLGDDEYRRFRQAGGSAGDLAYMVEQANAAAPGE